MKQPFLKFEDNGDAAAAITNHTDITPSGVILPVAPSIPPLTVYPPTRRKIYKNSVAQDTFQEFAKELRVNPNSSLANLVIPILINRGISSSALLQRLSPDSSHTPSPYLARNFPEAIKTLSDITTSKEPVCVVGDYDVDGMMSTAIVGRFLRAFDVPCSLILPNRFLDGFGINQRIVDLILKGHTQTGAQFKLVILADHGSQAHKFIDQLLNAGIEVIILDHHKVESPPKGIFVNPRQPGCGWSGEYPCAAQLAQRLCEEVAKTLGVYYSADRSSSAIAAIADMVSLSIDSPANRLEVRPGLADLRRTEDPVLVELFTALGISREPTSKHFRITSSDIAFNIAPALNAVGRLRDANICVELFTEASAKRRAEIIREIRETLAERKKLEGELLLLALNEVAQFRKLPPVIFLYNDRFHIGLVGLIAQKIAQRFGRPAIVCGPNGDKIAVASGRQGLPCYDVYAILRKADEIMKGEDPHGLSGFLRSGGHPPAGGASIHRDMLDRIGPALIKAFKLLNFPTPPDEIKTLADCSMRISDLDPKLFEQAESLYEPAGNGFPYPQIKISRCIVKNIRAPRNPGGRYVLRLKQGEHEIDALLGAEHYYEQDIFHGASLDIVATPIKFYRNLERSLQLSITAYVCLTSVDGNKDNSANKPSSPNPPSPSSKDISSQRTSYLLPKPKNLGGADFTTKNYYDSVARQSRKLREQLSKLAKLQNQFDQRFIYTDLEELVPDPWSPKPDEFHKQAWQKVIDDYQLHFDYSKLEMRPEALECIRWFCERNDNMILQAPTGSGKTMLALILASRYLKAGKRVIFSTRSRELANQVFEVVQQGFLGGETPRLLLMGDSRANKAKPNVHDFQHGIIIGSDAKLSRSIKNGDLKCGPEELVIADECHHTRNRDSSANVVRHARDQHARVVLLSATPWQVAAGKSTGSDIDLLKEISGARIFPLNRPPHRNKISEAFCELSPQMKEADARLRELMETYRDEIRSIIDGRIKSLLPSLHSAFALDTPDEIRMPTSDLLDSIKRDQLVLDFIHPSNDTQLQLKDNLAKHLEVRKTAIRDLTQKDGEYASINKIISLLKRTGEYFTYDSDLYWLSRGALELAHLNRILINDGVPGFMTRILEKRAGILFPKPIPRSEKPSAWGRHITELYAGPRSEFIQLAFEAVAPGTAKDLWAISCLEGHFKYSSSSWNKIRFKERATPFKIGIKSIRQAMLKTFESPDFFAHPADQFILNDILRDTSKKSFIWVDKVETAAWLAAHMNRQLEPYDLRAVALTGGMTSAARDQALNDFKNDPKTSVIIGTSTLNEGIDAEGTRGYDKAQKGSFIQSTQKAGRLGRRNASGEIVICLSTIGHYRTMLSNISKSIKNQEILNASRDEILAEAGLKVRDSEDAASADARALEQKWLF
jgi:single-stranded-DNA-specific exonuclease RecJ